MALSPRPSTRPPQWDEYREGTRARTNDNIGTAPRARVLAPQAARAVGASERTLARPDRAVLGTSPLGYVQALRVERATHLLQTTDAGIEHVAAEVGYADGGTLRALLRRRTGRGVRELRGRG